VSSILQGEGCVVQAASDGLEAIDIVARFRPDIIFTDLVMPGIDGMKLCHIIRNTPDYKNIFIVVLSGVALEDNTSFAGIGADICIAKGASVNMRGHIIAALHSFYSGNRDLTHDIQGFEGLYPRAVISELLSDKHHHEVVFEQMLEGYLELDGNGRVIRANPACCRIFQMAEVQFLASHLLELLPEKNSGALNSWMENLSVSDRAEPLVFDYDNLVVLHNHYITFRFIPVKEGHKLAIIGVMRDVTQHKEMAKRQEQFEQELGRMRILEAMTGMAGGIAHDFNNLLTVINSNVEMALLVTNDEKVTNLLGEANKALRLTTDLVRRFSQFSDNYLPEKSVVCIDDLLKDILLRELASTKIILNFISDGERQTADINSELIDQGFQNIIINAIEGMGGEGELAVCLSTVNSADDPDWPKQLIEEGKYVLVTFADTGRGMSQETSDKAFAPYFSSKERGNLKGMGLGLSIAYSAITKHGGLLRLSSSPGQGSKVFVYLPFTAPPVGRCDVS
jgi:PAS domain S-box-containing protein